ncbi:hypothetical protein PC123_g6819 [Phytophthora cactorum]|nr:hypothetical protein PC120_g6373 [Phytophthora cactorum]KAG4058211.1 hypothetical protein PC123_g6819 [Phytophthora cactorum]
MSTNSTSNDQANLACQVEAVKNNVIGEKTVKMYLRGISCYLVWLYQNKRSLLSDGLLEVVGNNEEAYLEHNDTGVGSLKKDAVLQFMRENSTVPPIQYDASSRSSNNLHLLFSSLVATMMSSK